MRLILHVGMSASGGAAIASVLSALGAGDPALLVPQTGAAANGAHHDLAFTAYGMAGRSEADLPAMLADLGAEIRRAAAGRRVQTVVLSSDCLFRFALDGQDSALWPFLRQTFAEIEVLIYVVRQDVWVETRHRQAVLSGGAPEPEAFGLPALISYEAPIAAWAERLPGARITLRVCEADQLQGGDVRADFCAAVGADPGLVDLSAPCPPEAPDLRTTRFKALVNHLALPGAVVDALNTALMLPDVAPVPDRSALSGARRRALIEGTEAENAAIARRWLGRGGPLFRDPLPDAAAPAADEPLTARDLSALVARVAASEPGLPGELAAVLAGVALVDLPHPKVALGLWQLDRAIKGHAAAEKRAALAGVVPKLPVPGAAGLRGHVFLHIGIFKTGSSSIQETLYANRGAGAGFNYPDLGMANGSLKLAIAHAAPESLVQRGFFARADEAERAAGPAQALIARQLAKVDPALPTVLSGETMAWFARAEMAGLVRAVLDQGFSLSFIGYLREPVTYFRSVFQERLKTGFPTDWRVRLAPDAPLAVYRDDLHRMVNRLDVDYGRDVVAAFAFDRRSFPGGDVVRHFLDQIGVPADKVDIRRQNEGLSLLAVKLLYTYRALKADRDASLDHPQSLEAFVASLAELGGQPFEFDARIAGRIAEANRAMLDWSAERLDRPLEPAIPPEGRGIGSVEQLMQFSEADLAAFQDLLRHRRVAGLPARPGPEDLAEAMHALRLSFIPRLWR
jgi:hypothetical protein